MPIVDATGVSLELAETPVRIVSLVPSTTETLFDIGAGERVIAVTRFCVRPDRARRQARVIGGTKTPDVDAILELEPDLVFANQEENRREDVLRLRERVPVYVAFPRAVAQAIGDVRAAGRLLGLEATADEIAVRLEERLETVRARRRSFRYLYFIWRRPYMVAGSSTFVDSLLSEAGGINVAPKDRGRYPEVALEEIEPLGADVLLLSSEPFPFEEKHRLALAESLGDPMISERIALVDGQLLSWHGTRLLEGLPYLEKLAARLTIGS